MLLGCRCILSAIATCDFGYGRPNSDGFYRYILKLLGNGFRNYCLLMIESMMNKWKIARYLLICVIFPILMIFSYSLFIGKDYTNEREEMTRNKTLWNGKNYTHYSYEYVRTGFGDYGSVYTVVVINDKVVSVKNEKSKAFLLSEQMRAFPSITRLFEHIDEGIQQKPPEVKVTYDPLENFPKSIYIDYDKDKADEEFSVKTQNFKKL
jgi:hypothetical protein